MKSCIVYSPTSAIENGFATSLPTREELRFYALYFDGLDIPSSRMMAVDLTVHCAYLRERDFPIQTTSQRSNIIIGQHGGVDALDALAMHQREEPNVWKLAHDPDVPAETFAGLEFRDSLIFQFNRMLPIPKKEMPLQDVLKFKEQNQSLLLDLRYSLSDLYSECSKTNFDEITVRAALSKLESAAAYVRERADSISLSKHEWSLKGALPVAPLIAELFRNPHNYLAAAAGGALATGLQTGTMPKILKNGIDLTYCVKALKGI